MPNTISEYRCLLISPTDVLREREALTHYINRWNAMIGSGLGVRVDLVRWESHVTPDLSSHPQTLINSQIVNSSDIGIAIFWSKIGTPTTEYESGSVEEIYQLLQRQARVMVYFCERPIPQANINNEQFLKLLTLKERLKVIGLYAEYTEISDLCEKVGLHLTNAITKLLERNKLVVAGISKSPREQIEELESAIINSSEPSITDSSVQNLAGYLRSKEIGVSRAAVRAMIALVDRNALPISVLALAKSTKISWEIRRNVVDRVRKESPDIALPLLNEFASSGFHTIQTQIRDYLRDIIDDESLGLTRIAFL